MSRIVNLQQSRPFSLASASVPVDAAPSIPPLPDWAESQISLEFHITGQLDDAYTYGKFTWLGNGIVQLTIGQYNTGPGTTTSTNPFTLQLKGPSQTIVDAYTEENSLRIKPLTTTLSLPIVFHTGTGSSVGKLTVVQMGTDPENRNLTFLISDASGAVPNATTFVGWETFSVIYSTNSI